MILPELNDIDISKLFSWGSKFSILDEAGEVILDYYMRLPGDADINRARVYALRQSAMLRRKLNTEDSDERLAFIAEEGLLSEEELRSYIMLYRTKDLYVKATREIDVPFPKEPKDDATLEEQELYQKKIDDYPTLIEEKTKEKLEEIIKREKDYLDEKDFKSLYSEYSKYSIGEICEQEMVKNYREMCVFFSSYSDDNYSTRLLKSVDEFKNFSPNIRQQFLKNFSLLEVDIQDLKKLPEAMQL